MSTDFLGQTGCADWSGGREVAPIVRYWVDSAHSGHWVGHLTVEATPLTPVTLAAGATYYAARLRILHALTAGGGACAGCDPGAAWASAS